MTPFPKIGCNSGTEMFTAGGRVHSICVLYQEYVKETESRIVFDIVTDVWETRRTPGHGDGETECSNRTWHEEDTMRDVICGNPILGPAPCPRPSRITQTRTGESATTMHRRRTSITCIWQGERDFLNAAREQSREDPESPQSP